MIDKVVEHIKKGKFAQGIVYERNIPPKEPDTISFENEIESEFIKAALKSDGIDRLYSHQIQAYKAVKKGLDTLITTPAASGKTFCYNIPIIEDMLNNPNKRGLYLFPIKALGYDQKKAFEEVISRIPIQNGLSVEILDGDTDKQKRRKILKNPPNIIISNVDIIHYSMLPKFQEWSEFIKNLKYVVIDEIHYYKGILGTQTYNLLKRFRRLASDIQFICASATIGNPESFAENLIGKKFYHIAKSGAGSGEKKVLIFNTDIPESALAQYLLKINLDAGIKTICFTKSRKITEKIYSKLIAGDSSVRNIVSSYRAGFLPEERREIEKSFHENSLKAVVATSAIEMGIDVGGVDSTILVGYPGSLMSLWQRAGRAGRGKSASLSCIIASNDALDQYYAKYPETLFEDTFEEVTIDKNNDEINKKHIICAAFEKPIHYTEQYFREMEPYIASLSEENRLFTDKAGEHFISLERYPHKNVDFRMAGDTFTLLCNNIIIGTNSGRRLYTEHFENAVYLHKGDHFIVKKIDSAKKEIHLDPFRGNYYTLAKLNKETTILRETAQHNTGILEACFCNLQVTETLTGYEKISSKTGEKLQSIDLEKEPVQFETKGFYLKIPEEIKESLTAGGFDFMGSIHALEHALIAMIPTFILCDRNDIAGISYPLHPQLETGGVFIYDSFAGGAGICRRVVEILSDLLKRTLKLISECECEEGCPSCIYSPKCGSGNYPLDKNGSKYLAEQLTTSNAHKISKGNVSIKTEHIRDNDVIIFDVETKYSAKDVGGWKNAHKMGISVSVVYSLIENKYTAYEEKDIASFINKIKGSKALIGFNIINFDLKVISGYIDGHVKSLTDDLKSVMKIDMLQDIRNITGRRFSLDNIASATINAKKTADGLQALEWYKEGNIDNIIEYCKKDVEVTKNLFLFGMENNKIYSEANGLIIQIPVNWKYYNNLID